MESPRPLVRVAAQLARMIAPCMHSTYPGGVIPRRREQALTTSTTPLRTPNCRSAPTRDGTITPSTRRDRPVIAERPALVPTRSTTRTGGSLHEWTTSLSRPASPYGALLGSARTRTSIARRTSAVASTSTRRAPAARSLRVGQRLDALPAVQPDSGHLDAMTTKGGANRGPVTADASGDVEQRGAQRQFHPQPRRLVQLGVRGASTGHWFVSGQVTAVVRDLERADAETFGDDGDGCAVAPRATDGSTWQQR